MKTIPIPKDYHHIAPDKAEIRELTEVNDTGLAHCILPANTTSQAVQHKTVSEIWHVLSGTGEIWRKSNSDEKIVKLEPGLSIDILCGTSFQYRSFDENLVFLCITTPLWPGPGESIDVENGHWS